MDDQQKHQLMFTQLVLMFQVATMQQLGKLKNPMTDKIERDLRAAQGSIDVLDMLKHKTKGNLTPEEERFINEILRELKLNYVDEMNKPEPAPPSQNAEGKNES